MTRKSNLKRLIRLVFALFGGAIGLGAMTLFLHMYLELEANEVTTPLYLTLCVVSTILFAIIFWMLTPPLVRLLQRWAASIEGTLNDTPLQQVASGAVGLIVGLVIAMLATQIFRAGLPDLLWAAIAAVIYLMLGYLGASIGAKRWRELPAMFGGRQARPERKAAASAEQEDGGKILDTSVIIDGRILDVCKTGFVGGPLIIPQFVLAELQHIADSSDPLRRNRGRRGLDILAQLQQELDIAVEITDADFEDVSEVDVKLLKLAMQIGGVVVTNDFNLNKVASVTGVKVLNLNDLAGALRPILLPGEEMTVQILREGKEHGQGIGYLEDGTMVVVDNGKRYIGDTIDVLVTSVLQTSAGRMIFTKVKDAA